MSFLNHNPETLQGIECIAAESLVAGTVTIYTPPDANTRFVITDISVMIQGANASDVVIYQDTNALVNLIYRHGYQANSPVNHHRPYNLPYVPGRGKAIKIDNPGGAQVRVVLHGYKAY